jgi:polyisoprenoid-binding protein YceI
MTAISLIDPAVQLPQPVRVGDGRWIVDATSSQVQFAARGALGACVTGRIADVSGVLNLTSDGASNISMVLAAHTVDVDSARWRPRIAGPNYLDAARHPLVMFTADDVTATSLGWVSRGQLRVKRRSRRRRGAVRLRRRDTALHGADVRQPRRGRAGVGTTSGHGSPVMGAPAGPHVRARCSARGYPALSTASITRMFATASCAGAAHVLETRTRQGRPGPEPRPAAVVSSCAARSARGQRSGSSSCRSTSRK